MTEFVPAPASYNWSEVLATIPSGQAVVLHYTRRHLATLAGESARSFARYNKLGKLHTRVSGGVIDPTSGAYLDVECDVTLLLWF